MVDDRCQCMRVRVSMEDYKNVLNKCSKSSIFSRQIFLNGSVRRIGTVLVVVLYLLRAFSTASQDG